MFELTAENLERIRRQNEQKISVIIGNPPYNANQLNENDNNKNRPYPAIDARIKGTYVKESTAQKTKVYDMYARFLRWASDRVGENGVVAFVSNNSFINAATFDGFRKCVAQDFNEIHVIDMKGNARTSGERRQQEGGNVFSDTIRVGVAVYFLVRKEGETGSRIFYNAVGDYWTDDQKKTYLRDNKLQDIDFKHIVPDKNGNWIHQSESNWDAFLPVATKETKFANSQSGEQAIFKLYSLGIATNRDEWVYDFSDSHLEAKVRTFCEIFEGEKKRWLREGKDKAGREIPINDFVERTIKWTSELEQHLIRGTTLKYDSSRIRGALHRPFTKMFGYYDRVYVHRLYQQDDIFPIGSTSENIVICVNTSKSDFNVLVSKYLVDLHFNGDSQCLPLYRYDKAGNRLENITDWGLTQFRTHYKDESISRQDIFNYVYGVLHDPAYRKKYELNLRREFPRVPFYENFAQWAAWGETLLKLHVDFETVEPYPLTRTDDRRESRLAKQRDTSRLQSRDQPNVPNPKAKLKADKAAGEIVLDSQTTLSGVPAAAWEYRLGNRSALEWVLERYKERTPKDKTVAERFNTYRFADYKEDVVTLLGRVCAVSVATSEIVEEMAKNSS